MDFAKLQNLKKLAEGLSEKISDSDKFFTGVLASRLVQASYENPSDVTIKTMASFLSKRSESGNSMISRSELKQVYSKLYTTSTRCDRYISKELGSTILPFNEENKVEKVANRKELDMYAGADKDLVDVLSSLLSSGGKVANAFSKTASLNAINVCERVLPGNPSIDTFAGREDFIICRATWETPKGKASALVPVEILENKALLPQVFISKLGFEQISKDAIKDHLKETAGKALTVNASDVFAALDAVKGKPEAISDVERIVALAKASTPAVDTNAVIYKEFTFDKFAETKTNKESETFAKKLSSMSGIAEFAFGSDIVNKARNLVSSKLSKLGYNAQVKVIDATEDEIIVGASIGGVGFKVPVKVSNSSVESPGFIISNGSIRSFDQFGVKEVIGYNDRAVAAVVNGFDKSRPSDLINVVMASCDNKEYELAKDALSALSEVSSAGFKEAFAYYQKSTLGEIQKEASVNIPYVVIGGNKVCAKTGLPLDKVTVDENGDIVTKQRKSSSYDQDMVGGFMNAKVFI